ncbi:uncharacterized protein LOC110181299 [Drosophila serrata]|uniref:uncharacterized protein LOC110181299 n=1 Tax=Drosophila serrata TaxID=7274 RepID=UPI000A1D1F45|nr:uncharacterized protein LOC110181299 [Drosophila serrata]
MKVLLFLYFLAVVKTEEFITMRLNDIAEKYRHQSWGNGEFSTWVERVYYAGKKPKGNKEEKKKVLDAFMQYDTQRQYLEDKITDRINEIESLIPNRQLSQVCVTDYQAQKSRLQRAYKFSNSEKQRIIDANSNIVLPKMLRHHLHLHLHLQKQKKLKSDTSMKKGEFLIFGIGFGGVNL